MENKKYYRIVYTRYLNSGDNKMELLTHFYSNDLIFDDEKTANTVVNFLNRDNGTPNSLYTIENITVNNNGSAESESTENN